MRVIRPEGVRVPVPERYRLFDHIREVAGLRLSAAVGTLLPRLADELLAAAGATADSRTRAALQEAAQVLREEADIRCESAVGALDERHFESLQEPVVTDSGTPTAGAVANAGVPGMMAVTTPTVVAEEEAFEVSVPAYCAV